MRDAHIDIYTKQIFLYKQIHLLEYYLLANIFDY
jgi:hypothetical protein